jgi:4-amino-4-deoxy-L-arabinose transferase-like glycosyltransferase
LREGLSRRLWLALVISAFCIPLFIGLGRTDLENDEGIYSFAVDEILINGDWLNPRSSPDDDVVFREKPPLKFWVLAAPIRFGLLPHDEFGLRFWDALFAGIAFVYVFAIGRQLAGPLCGFVAVAFLFGYGPLLFDHGLRGNYMEAPLFLCYCGGVYHYIAWVSAEGERQRRGRHVVAVALYFFLGFMTKFVAALLLPLVLGASALVHAHTRARLREDLVRWVAAAAFVVALTAPWFIYQQVTAGNQLWRIMLGVHVYTRFTTALDPGHIQPWTFYFAAILHELRHMGALWLALGGLVLLAVVQARQRRADATVVLLWFALPVLLISAVPSKLDHYAYPFLPPIALASGFGFSWLFSTGRLRIDAVVHEARRWLGSGGWSRTIARNALLIVAVAAAVLAVATLVLGTVQWRIGGVRLLRNSHASRSLALLIAILTVRGRLSPSGGLPAALLLVLLGNAYENAWDHALLVSHPLRSARECLMHVRSAEMRGGSTPPPIYAVREQTWFLHSYYYYLRHLGHWERTGGFDPQAVDEALFRPGRQRPVLIGAVDYKRYAAGREGAVQSVPSLRLRDAQLLMPGPYAVCAGAARAGG